MQTPEIFVVGGGPAGLAAAIAARQRGMSVIVADGAWPPIDKPCGEGLMPDACEALAKLGIQIPPRQSRPFRGIQFLSGNQSAEGNFPSGTGLAVRRTVLHRLMIEKAEAAGVLLRWRTPVTGLHADGVRIGKQLVRARWVIGADGSNSLVRRWAGLDRFREKRRFALRQHFRVSPWSDYVEVHWGVKRQIYMTPLANEEVCIAVVSSERHLCIDDALKSFPELAARLRGAEISSPARGAISSTRKLREVHRGRVALLGDASGSVDCVTGEGLGLAFCQAGLLVDCLAQDDLGEYRQKRAVLSRRPALMSRLLLLLDRHSSFTDRAMRAFGADPQLFSRMVAMHVGALPALDCAAVGLSLGWRLLTC